jgi:hypothetical protein
MPDEIHVNSSFRPPETKSLTIDKCTMVWPGCGPTWALEKDDGPRPWGAIRRVTMRSYV